MRKWVSDIDVFFFSVISRAIFVDTQKFHVDGRIPAPVDMEII